jgi:integrase
MSRRKPGEGSVTSYLNASGEPRWRCQWRELKDASNPRAGKRTVGRAGFRTQKQARDVLREQLVLASRGKTTAKGRTTFDSYARRWLAVYSCQPSTRLYIQRVLDAVQPHIGGLQVEHVLPTDLAACYRALENGDGRRATAKNKGGKLAPSTVARYSGWLVTIFNAALDEGLISRNPASHRLSGRPRGQQARRTRQFDVWSVEQVSAFCGWAVETGQPWGRAWWLLVLTGLRSGELLALEWTDIDLSAGTLSVRRAVRYNETLPAGSRSEIAAPKHGSARTVRLDTTAVDHLRAVRKQQLAAPIPVDQGLRARVFPPAQGRSPSQPALLSAFRRAQSVYRDDHVDAHLPEFSIHDLRHTHASLLLAAGVDVKVIQERIGHSSAAITLSTYTHLMPNAHQRAAERLQALLEA